MAPPPPLSLPFPPGLYILHPPSDPRSPPPPPRYHLLFRTHLSPRPPLGIRANHHPASQTLVWGFFTYILFFSLYSSVFFSNVSLTEVTFLVLLARSFLLIYFATPPGSYSPSPHPPPPILSAHRNHFFLFFLSSFG